MKTVAIIVAGGLGKRIEGDLPKQFLNLGGKPILAHSIDKFQRCDLVDEIILVVPEDHLGYCSQAIVEEYSFDKIRKIVCGGKERQDSVYQGLKSCSNATSCVVIHDGVRPLISVEKITKSIELCRDKKAVILAVPAKDTIKRVVDCSVVTTLDRTKLWLVQTPQVFEYRLIRDAYEKAVQEDFIGTDDSVLVERLGCDVTVLEGEYTNIKITTREDLILAEKLLDSDKTEF
jgi:2-C-methyl-D-erythritol 4-phosphate cytidylyltransferase